MSFPDEEKIEVKPHTQPFRDTISTVPFKKRRLFFPRSPSPPPEIQSSPTLDYDTTQNKSSCLVQVSSLEAGDLPTPMIALSDKGLSLDSGFKILSNVDINKPPLYQDSIGLDFNDMKHAENGLEDIFNDGKLVSLKGVERPSAPLVCVDLPMAEKILDAENISNETSAAEKLYGKTELHREETFEKIRTIESCFVRKEKLELQDPSYRYKQKLDVDETLMKGFLSGPNTVSAQISLHRSNWDLNMTMDTWEESSSDSAVKNDEFNGSCRPGFGSSLDIVPLPNFMGTGTTNKTPNASQPVVGEHLISEPFLSLHTSLKSGPSFCNFETEAYLELCLKPSFIPESYENPINLREVDSLKEMNFLNLSMKPTSSAREPFFLGCGTMKPRCIQHVEKKADFSISETLVLKPIKSESHEIGEASRAAVSSDAAIKPEPEEERDQSPNSVNGTSAFHISAYNHNLLRNAKIPLEAVGTHIMSSFTKSDLLIKDMVSQTPTEYPNILKYEVDGMTQVNQAPEVLRSNKKCHSAMSAVSSILQPEVGFEMQPFVHERGEFIPIKQASNEGIEHAGFFSEFQLEGGQNMMLLSHSCDQDDNTAAALLHESCNEKSEALFQRSLSETDTKAGPRIESHLNFDDIILQTPREPTIMPNYEEDSMTQVKQATEVSRNNQRCHIEMSAVASTPQPALGYYMQPSVDVAKEFVSIKEASNEGSEHADLFIKCRSEGQNMKLSGESCDQDDIVVDLLQESSVEKPEVVSIISLSDAKTRPGVETHPNCDDLEFDQPNNELLCMMEQQGDSECKPAISDFIDGVIPAVHEKSEVDHNYEDGELRDGASLSANGGSHLTIEIEKAEEFCPRGLVDVPVVVSSHEDVKHTTIKSPEMYADPGTIECINDVDPGIAADMQESSSVTGDSSGKKTIWTTRKVSRDSLMKNKVFEQKTKFDRDPTFVNIDYKGEGSGVMENSRENFKSSLPLSGESKRDAADRGRSGRIINLNSASARKMNHIHEGPLPSRVGRENSAYKSFKSEKCPSRCRDEIPSEGPHKTENESQRGWICGKGGSGSVHMRVRAGSNSPQSRIRDEPKINQFGERSSNLNYMREQIHGHDGFGRLSRKVTNKLEHRAHMLSRWHSPGDEEQMPDMHHPTSETSPSRCMQRAAPDLVYVSHEKNCRPITGGMLDRAHLCGQFEQTNCIPNHRERLSLSPVRRRGPPQFSPAISSPRSRARSPSHWPRSRHATPEGFNGQSEMVHCRSSAPDVNLQRFTEEILPRRRGVMEVAPSRGRDFPRKVQRRQFTGEYRGSSFGRSQIHEHAEDSEYGVRRRYNDVHEPGRYRQRFITGDDGEDCSFHTEEGDSPRSYRYHADGNQGFNEGGSSREFEGRFKNRLGNTPRRYRQVEQQQQQQQLLHEDGFRHQEEQGWNDSGFNNGRPRSRRYQ